jgi:hypothetical protein
MELFSLRKIRRICPQHRGPGPPAPAHGSTDFIKRRPLATRSMAQIKRIESVSQLLISVVHHRSDGWDDWVRPGAASARARSDVSRPSTTAHRSSSFLELHGWFLMRFAPTGSQQWGERVYANLNRQRAAMVLVDGEGGLRWSFNSKDVCQGFLEVPSSFWTDQLLRSAVENLNLVAT